MNTSTTRWIGEMSVADLKKTIDEQQAVIVNYESKLKGELKYFKLCYYQFV